MTRFYLSLSSEKTGFFVARISVFLQFQKIMLRSKQFFAALLTLSFAISFFGSQNLSRASEEREKLDVLFINGTLIDGSGAERVQADVGIAGDTIHAIGQNLAEKYEASRVIDIAGKFIAPGYIDVHTHADRVVFGDDQERKAALNFLYQGITTINVGADGRHWRKFDDQREGQISKLYDFIDENGFGMNVFLLLGHNNIRREVMGDDYRRFTTEAEMEEMGRWVRQFMEEGALGMSLGLEYASGRYSDIDELIYLAKVLGDYDTRSVIISHERATGPQHRYYIPSNHNARGLYQDRFRKYPDGWDVIDYIKEGIEIAESSGIVFDFTHIKITHESYWGKSAEVIELIEDARARGAKIYAEHMPFTNSGNSPLNLSIIPGKYYTNTQGSNYPYSDLEKVLADPDQAEWLRKDIAWQIDKHGGIHSIDIIDSDSRPDLIGKSLADLSEEWEIPDPVDVILEIKKTGDVGQRSGARFRSKQTLSFEDVANFARTDWVGTVTDGSIVSLQGGFSQPRHFGSFPKKIELLVKENDVITLEHAIRAGTGLPAKILSLPDRGLLREGWKADIQVFDLDELAVKATWTLTDSRAYSEGIYYVMVNGEFALDNKEPTFVLNGKSLRNQELWNSGSTE